MVVHADYSDEPITDWLIFIGGYMQNRSLATSGLCGTAKQAYDRYDSRVNKYAGKRVLVDYNPWKTDMKSTAEWIYRWSGYDRRVPGSTMQPPTIMVVAYSWGAGWGLCQLAMHLAYRGLRISVAVVSDAVRHVGWSICHTIPIAQVCAYMPWWKIKKPGSIQEFHPFRQSRKRSLGTLWADFWNSSTLLYGHPWVEEDANGNWHECMNMTGVPLANHTNMDDAQPFRDKVFDCADRLFLPRAA